MALPIEISSWGERAGVEDAVAVLLREHARRHSKDVLLHARSEQATAARRSLQTRMHNHEPPDTFQANAGADLLQWVVYNGLSAQESRLLPLDGELPAVNELRRSLPQPLLDRLSYDGKLYAVPATIHRINSIFYNKRVLERFGLSEPRTLDELWRMAATLKGSGVDLIAIGTRAPWTLALVVFECLMVAQHGVQFYNEYFAGSLRPDDPRIEQTLNLALQFLTLVNSDHGEMLWNNAVDRVVSGGAAMTIMGDWCHWAFSGRGMELGKDYGEIPFPGTQNAFVFTADTFALPKAAKNKAGALRLLGTIASREAQLALSRAKQSIPPRSDVPASDNPALRDKAEIYRHGDLALALSGAVPPRFAADLASALAEMASSRNTEPVMHTLRSRYALLK